MQRISSGFDFSEQYHKDGDEFLSHIVRITGYETWVSFVNVETKEQSKQWIHTRSPNKPKFMQQGTIISGVYCETLKKTA
jgi:hypothetical protein